MKSQIAEAHDDLDKDLALTEWSNEPTVMQLKQDYLDAQTHHEDQVTKIDNWLDNLHVRGTAKPNTPKGSSQMQPKVIRKQAEWRYAALSEPFLSNDGVFKVEPVSWEDKAAAEQNQILLNNQFNTKINKVNFIDEYVRAGVDEGTIILRVGWDFQEEEYEAEVPIVEYVINPSFAPMHEELAQLKQTNPTQYYTEVPEEVRTAHDMTLEEGTPIEPRVVGTEVQTLTRTLKNCPTVEVCQYQNVTIDPSCNGDVSKAGFIIYSFESSISELKKDGRYSNLDNINIEANSILGEPDHTTDETKNFNFSDKPRKKFVVYEYWGLKDINGDGKLVPIVASWVGSTKIRMEENPFPDKKHPFIVVPYLPVRKSVYGEPDGELLIDNQKVIGAVTRGMIDLLGKSANGQTGMRKDMLDAVNKRRFERGEDYEFNHTVDPRLGVHMHQFPEIPNSAQFMLQSQNYEAESMTGVKAFSEGLSGNALGDVATGVRGVLDAASKRELGILRRLADGIVQVGRKFIAMNAEWLDEMEVVRVTNDEFIPVKRDDLPGNFDLKLSISSAEEDNAKAQELAFMLQTGAASADPAEVRMIRAEIARLRKMPELAKRIEEYQPQPDPIEEQRKLLELELLKAEIANEQAHAMERQAGALLDQANAGKAQSDTDLNNLNYVEQESGVTQERELQRQGAQARANMQLEALKQRLNNLGNTSNSA